MTRTDAAAVGGDATDRVVLALLAHQDDEFALLPMIDASVRQGMRVAVVYATRHPDDRMEQTRQRESERALASLGVASRDIAFVGAQSGIVDGRSHERVAALLRGLAGTLVSLRAQRPRFCFVPAWEGGHPDHDVTHGVAVVLAERGLLQPERLCAFPLYTAGSIAPFRVMHWRAGPERATAYRFGLRDALRYVGVMGLYRSQRRSFAGLFPEAALRYLVARRVSARDVAFDAVRRRPHAGSLLYERRFGVRYEAIAAALAPWLARPRSVGPA